MWRERRLLIESIFCAIAFENLLVLTKGKEAIVDLFCLTELVPGCIWSELGEVFENIYYG